MLNRLSLVSGILVAVLATTASAQGKRDPLAESLGFSAGASGSLPPWSKPSQEARQDLGEFVRKAEQAVMLVGSPKAIGTAWVVSKKERLLVTNAHVADFMHKGGGTMMAIPSGTSTVYKVVKAWYHPGVRRIVGGGALIKSSDPSEGPIYPSSPDVAIIQLSDDGPELPFQIEMAAPEVLETLFAQPTAMLGYPARDTKEWPQIGETAQATFHDGVVSRMTNFHNSTSCPAAEKQFLQYTMLTWGGFSGSPVFLPSGKVIAVNNSARYEEGERGDVQGVAHGIRIDCVWELIAHHGLDDRIPIPVEKSMLNIQRWLEDDPADADLRKAMALVREGSDLIYNQQKFSEGVTRCSEAVKLAPGYGEAYNIRCDGYINYWFKHRREIDEDAAFKQLQYAEQDAKKYASLCPSDPWATLNFVLIYNNAGQQTDDDDFNRKALNIVNKLLESDNLPATVKASAYSNRAIAYDNLDEDDQAERDHNEAVRIDPKNPQWYDNRADFWRYQGRGDLEEQDYETARKLRAGR